MKIAIAYMIVSTDICVQISGKRYYGLTCLSRQVFPNANFRYVSNAGHWVHADNPEEFLDVLLAFISSS